MKRVLLAGVVATICVVGIAWQAVSASPPFGSSTGSMRGGPAVSGTVSYRERVELPGKAMVHVELIDVSEKDARTATIGEQTIWTAWVPLPVEFRIEYDPSRIDPRHVYILRARIVEGEKLLFMNTTPYYVLTRGAPSKVNLIVTPAR
jgi:putative lipoprotein